MTKSVTCFEYAKMQLIELQTEQEAWMEKNAAYKAYENLPFWKKLFTSKVERPYFSRCCDVTLYQSRHMVIAFRMYFHEDKRELSYVINEDGYGFKYNVDTDTKESLIGSKGTQVSAYAETMLNSTMRLINPLIIE